MADTAAASAGHERLTAFVLGHVQGVGFRWWTRSRARELGRAGHGTNLQYARGQVFTECPLSDCEKVLSLLREEPSTTRRPGVVNAVVEQWAAPRGESGFIER